MKIALDAQLTVGTATGIGEYVRGLSAALRAEGAEMVELSEPRLDPWRFDRRLIWDQVLLPRYARAANADVLHCASGTMPFASLRKQDGTQMPIVVTVHDVAWLRVQTHTKWYARRYFGKFALARYRRAARIVVDSEFSRKELLSVFAEDDGNGHVPAVDTVYPGVSEEYCTLSREPAARSILVAGTVEPRKNLAFLISLLPKLPDAHIVSIGPFTPYADECRKFAQTLGVAERVELRGYVPRAEVIRLYATCAVVAVPSTYEGFGYAAAQALCAGVPAVVSDRSSLPEVAGSDAAHIPLENSDAWVEILRNALNGKLNARAQEARDRSIQRFHGRRAAKELLHLFEEVTER